MEVVPTITTTAIDTFEYLFSRFVPSCKTFQIDIQDGILVPSKTFTARDLLSYLQNLAPERLKTYKSATFDFHLMEIDYKDSLQAVETIASLIRVRYVFVHMNFLHSLTTSLTLCPTINPEDRALDELRMLDKPLITFPAIQVMTIHPGPQGQAFIPKQLERIRDLRDAGFKGDIIVDGAINQASLRHILSLPKIYHPDCVCVGSYFSRAPDYEIVDRVETLRSLLKSYPNT